VAASLVVFDVSYSLTSILHGCVISQLQKTVV